MRRMLVALWACSWVAVATGDVIVTRDGRRIEGRVVARRGGQVIVQVERATLRAELAINEADIAAIESQSQTSFEALVERYQEQEKAAAKTDSADGWEVLAHWSKEHGLDDQAQRAVDRSLMHRVRAAELARGADPWSALAAWCDQWGRGEDAHKYHLRALSEDAAHAPSHVALGHRQLDGRWLDPAAWKEANAEKMRLAGYVEIDGQWHTALAAQAIGQLRAQDFAKDVEALRGTVERALEVGQRRETAAAARIEQLTVAQQQQAAEIARLHDLLAQSARERESLYSALRAARCRCSPAK